MTPPDLAAAIRDVVDMPRSDMKAWRARIATAAAERYTWPVAAATYRALLRGFAGHSSVAA